MSKNYYPQVFLEECKHVVKKNMMSRFINTELKVSPVEYDQEDSDEEYIKTK